MLQTMDEDLKLDEKQREKLRLAHAENVWGKFDKAELAL